MEWAEGSPCWHSEGTCGCKNWSNILHGAGKCAFIFGSFWSCGLLLILFLNVESSTLARYSSFYLADKVIVYPNTKTKFRIVQIKYFKSTPKEEQYCTLLLASCSKAASLNHGNCRNSRKGNLKSNVIGLVWVIYSPTRCCFSNNKITSWDQCARQGLALHSSISQCYFLGVVTPKTEMNNNSQISKWYCQISISLYFWTSLTKRKFPLDCLICTLRKEKCWIVVSVLLGVTFVCLLRVSGIKFQQGYVFKFRFLFFFGAQTSHSPCFWIRV